MHTYFTSYINYVDDIIEAKITLNIKSETYLLNYIDNIIEAKIILNIKRETYLLNTIVF